MDQHMNDNDSENEFNSDIEDYNEPPNLLNDEFKTAQPKPTFSQYLNPEITGLSADEIAMIQEACKGIDHSDLYLANMPSADDMFKIGLGAQHTSDNTNLVPGTINPEIHHGYDGMTPLIFAVRGGNIYLMELLIGHGADVNLPHLITRLMPLNYAIEIQNLEVVQLLLIYGANVNSIDAEGKTPIMQTIEISNFDLFKILLANGADINVRDFKNKSIVDYALQSKNPKFLQEMIITNKIDINAQNSDGVSQLISATTSGSFNMVEFLLENNADVNLQDKNGDTALSWAVFKRYVDIAGLLLDPKYGVLVNTQDKNKQTPLHIAITKCPEFVFTLLNHPDINLNLPDKDNNTPLHYAVIKNQIELTENLLTRGADPNQRNNAGKSPAALARESRNNQLIALFGPNITSGSPESIRIKELLVKDTKDCPICMSELTMQNSIMTSCIHIFCAQCLDATFKSNANRKCPLCRVDL